MHIAVMEWGQDGRVAKFQDCPTQPEALAHVEAYSDDYPDAFVAADPGGGWSSWKVNGGTLISEPIVPAINAVDVERERDRRLELGFDFNFGDARGVHRIGTTEKDMKAWDREVTPAATALVNLGDTTTTIKIKTDTGSCEVTGMEWMAILDRARTVRQPIWQGYFTLIEQDPIPADYATNEAYWPGGE